MPHRRPAVARLGTVLVLAVAVTAATPTPAHAAGAVLYVSPTGSDTAAGTPFRTIQRALDVARPGTTIVLAPGDYREALVTRVAGTADAPITITGPGGRDRAVLHGVGGPVVSIDHSFYALDGFTVDGRPGVADDPVVSVGAATGVTLSDMVLIGAGGDCVHIDHDDLVDGDCGSGDEPASATRAVLAEAESGTLTSPMGAFTDATARGGRYVAGTAGADAITVTVPVAGRYAAALRVTTPGLTAVTTAVDGGPARAWALRTHTSWTWVTGPLLMLRPGPHTIVVAGRAGGARIDALRLTPVG
jgi:hypothetical protein